MPQFLIYNLLFLTLGAAHVRRIFSFNSLNNKLDWISPSSYKETDEVPISDVKVKKMEWTWLHHSFIHLLMHLIFY